MGTPLNIMLSISQVKNIGNGAASGVIYGNDANIVADYVASLPYLI